MIFALPLYLSPKLSRLAVRRSLLTGLVGSVGVDARDGGVCWRSRRPSWVDAIGEQSSSPRPAVRRSRDNCALSGECAEFGDFKSLFPTALETGRELLNCFIWFFSREAGTDVDGFTRFFDCVLSLGR